MREPIHWASPSSSPGSKRCGRPSRSAASTARRLVDAVHDEAPVGQRHGERQADVAQSDDTDRGHSSSPSATSRLALREVGETADVEPVLADREGHDRAPRLLEERDQVGRVERLAARNQGQRRRRDDIDAAVDQEVQARLLADGAELLALHLQHAVGHLHRVRHRPHGEIGPVPPMKVEHRAEIALGEDVAVDEEERRGERLGQQREAAGGPERNLLADVADAHTQARAVAEVRLDHFRFVVDREEDLLHAGRPQPLDEDLQQRLAAHAQQRLGHGVGERTQARPEAARHQHRRVGQWSGTQQVLEQEHVDQHGRRPRPAEGGADAGAASGPGLRRGRCRPEPSAGWAFITSPTGPSRETPRRRPRRTSPSVTMPGQPTERVDHHRPPGGCSW